MKVTHTKIQTGRPSNWLKISLIFGLPILGGVFCRADGEPNSRHVNLFIGTAGDNGQVDPGAAVPYGMICVCPDSDPRSHSGYDFEVPNVSGFSINRLSGVGGDGAGGNLRLKPAAWDQKIHIDKSTEIARPGYYSVAIDGVAKTEFTATHNVAVERYVYAEGKESLLALDVNSAFTSVLDSGYKVISPSQVQGFIQAKNTCNHGAYKLYFDLVTNKPFKVLSQEKSKVLFSFGPGDGSTPVEVRIAVSSLNEEAAARENAVSQNIGFDQIKKQAEDAWENILSRVDVTGGNDEDRTLFYTCLYRAFLSPANVTSTDGRFLGTDGKIHEANGFTYYSAWSMWDAYRTKLPLITLLDAKSAHDFGNSLCKLYVYGKKDWSTKFEATPTVRTEHTITVLLDMYRKGITDIPLEEAYAGMKKEMDGLQLKRPDLVLEDCMDWWAMAGIAAILNKTADTDFYDKKSKVTFVATWDKEFKNIDDSYKIMRNNGLYQGTRWQYRWALPQYLDQMAESVGGRQVLLDQLDYYFANNLFNQSNEPDLQVPFIFNRLGAPDKTQRAVWRIVKEDLDHRYGGNAEYPQPYHGKPYMAAPRGFMPEMDEDDGTMGSWYVFAAMGLYPLVVGEPWYEITSPFFDSVTIHLDNGRDFVIKTSGRKAPDDIIKQARFNGKMLTDFRINHNDLVKGGVLELQY